MEYHTLADWDGYETDSDDESSASSSASSASGESAESDLDEYDELERVAAVARDFHLTRRVSKGDLWEGVPNARACGDGPVIIKFDFRGARPPCEARALARLQDTTWAPRCQIWLSGPLRSGEEWTATVMEKVPGVPLDARRLTAEEVAAVTRQLLAMCADVHARGYAYCDFRATNALMEGAGAGIRVRLIDFDCAQRLDGAEPICHCYGARAARAPEKWRRRYGAPADLWAIGVVAGQLLLGVRDRDLPDRGFENALRAALAAGSTPLERLVLRLLADDPAARPTATEALEAL